jgi:RNA polymerase sigma-32 factor
MELRTAARDFSLDSTVTEDNSVTYIDTLAVDSPSQEEIIEGVETNTLAHRGLEEGLTKLSPREKRVIERRYLSTPQGKLRELGDELGISKERVRQIEVQALKKLKGEVESSIDSGHAHAD